jgi:hypothetical protein
MRGRAAPAPLPAHATQAVYGLDAGRADARRKQRVRSVWNRAVTVTMTIGLLIGLAAAGWFGYQVYLDHSNNAELEHQQGVEEYERQHANDSMDDIIDDVEQTPAFNGPGAPALGLGADTTQP